MTQLGLLTFDTLERRGGAGPRHHVPRRPAEQEARPARGQAVMGWLAPALEASDRHYAPPPDLVWVFAQLCVCVWMCNCDCVCECACGWIRTYGSVPGRFWAWRPSREQIPLLTARHAGFRDVVLDPVCARLLDPT